MNIIFLINCTIRHHDLQASMREAFPSSVLYDVDVLRQMLPLHPVNGVPVCFATVLGALVKKSIEVEYRPICIVGFLQLAEIQKLPFVLSEVAWNLITVSYPSRKIEEYRARGIRRIKESLKGSNDYYIRSRFEGRIAEFEAIDFHSRNTQVLDAAVGKCGLTGNATDDDIVLRLIEHIGGTGAANSGRISQS